MDVKALTFDTGGTILDWHTGFKQAIERVVTANEDKSREARECRRTVCGKRRLKHRDWRLRGLH